MNNFCDAMEAAGITPPSELYQDGRIHRFCVEGDRRGSRNGWYCLFDDPSAGSFGSWKTGVSETWSSKEYGTLTAAEKTQHRANLEAAKAERARLQAEIHAEASRRAQAIWPGARPAKKDHPYLAAKGIKPHGARESRGSLTIPLRDGQGMLCGLQFIRPDGTKRYLSGSKKEGSYFSLGGKPTGTLYLVEGFATGATIHEATGEPVAVAFDASNLQPVGEVLRSKFPEIQLIFCGDSDQWTEGNPGLSRATEAARAVGGLLAVPSFKDVSEKPSDFNDLARLEGLGEVKRQIEKARAPEAEGFDGNGALEVLRGCDVEVTPVSWLWKGWLASGKLHILAGSPGTGKTTIALTLAAILTTGGKWQDGTQAPLAEAAIWSGEDDPADTLAPRLIAAGADMSRVHFIRSVNTNGDRRPFDPGQDLPHLASYLHKNRAIKLLIVDPVVSAVTGDSHKNTEVRRNLQPLVDLGAGCGCAVLGISHFSKGTAKRDPLERVVGSIAFGALARIVLVAAKKADDAEGNRLFARCKSNIGPDDGGWLYRFETGELEGHQGVITSRILWGSALEGDARELLEAAEDVSEGAGENALEDAKQFLADLLADGPAPSRQIKRESEDAGFAWATIRRAQKNLGVEVFRDGGLGSKGTWKWRFSTKMLNNPLRCSSKNVSTLTEFEHLSSRDNPYSYELNSPDAEEQTGSEVLVLTAEDFF
jgi:putative DNA primase/helicase